MSDAMKFKVTKVTDEDGRVNVEGHVTMWFGSGNWENPRADEEFMLLDQGGMDLITNVLRWEDSRWGYVEPKGRYQKFLDAFRLVKNRDGQYVFDEVVEDQVREAWEVSHG